jgi:hypothetical protein
MRDRAMTTKSEVIRCLSLSFAAIVFLLIGGSFYEAKAQCNGDPFCTPSWKKPKTQTTTVSTSTDGNTRPEKKGPAPVTPVTAPSIEQRIAYYKQLREDAAMKGLPIPKVTSVLTLDEMVVTGIFKTSRGYSAMVEATPIKLSYTIYPGEKFFDGQLVAIEENRVIFRKVTKMSNNKFVTSVENKVLRQYTTQQEVQGTAPVQSTTSSGNQTEVVSNKNQTTETSRGNKTDQPVSPTRIISPVEEMNNQPEEKPKDSVKDKDKDKDKDKKSRKPVKLARKS